MGGKAIKSDKSKTIKIMDSIEDVVLQAWNDGAEGIVYDAFDLADLVERIRNTISGCSIKNAELYKNIGEADKAFQREHPNLDISDDGYYREFCNWLMSKPKKM